MHYKFLKQKIHYMSEYMFLKLLTIAGIILLVMAALGFIQSYVLLRWDIMGLSIILMHLSITSRRYWWAGVFIIFILLFNPIYPPKLTRFEWQIIDVTLIIVLLLWLWDYFTAYRKGVLFEKFVLAEFPKEHWVVVESTMDLHKKIKRFVESDGNPDFLFRRRSNGKLLAVECKYRSYLSKGKFGDLGLWWKKEQGERYAQYGLKHNLEVLIAFGIEGNPTNPKHTGFVPLDLIQKQYPRFIPLEVILKYAKIS